MKLLFAVFAMVFLLAGCQTMPKEKNEMAENTTDMEEKAEMGLENVAEGEYHKLTAEEAFKMMSEQDVIIVDVRTESEYNEGHIENAVVIPNESISELPPEELTDKDATLLVYCRSGRRSKEASEKLLALGYKNVYDFGGIIDWPYEVVKSN